VNDNTIAYNRHGIFVDQTRGQQVKVEFDSINDNSVTSVVSTLIKINPCSILDALLVEG
jgi:hypothetical protein